MDDGALLLNIARSLAATCRDSTAYLFAHRQKPPTNNLLGQRISHTVLSEFPDASLRTYPRLASREQGQSRPGKGTCAVEHEALGQPMTSRIRRSARSSRLPSMPATCDSTIAVAGTAESNGPRPSTSRGEDDENLGPPGVGMHCYLEDVALVAAEVEDNANVTFPDVRRDARVVRGGHRVSSGA
jgi:hypothetical protein